MPSNGSFGAASFGVRITGANRDTSAEMSEMHIPGSDNTVIDIGGLLPEKLSYELYFATSSDYDTMRGLVGTADTLSAFDLSGTAYLKSLRRTWTNPIGDNATLATAEFIMAAPGEGPA